MRSLQTLDVVGQVAHVLDWLGEDWRGRQGSDVWSKTVAGKEEDPYISAGEDTVAEEALEPPELAA